MRLIDADLAKAMFMHRARLVHYGFEDRLCVPYDAVDEVPTVGDAVPVVRCRDCKHAEPYKRYDGATGYYCHCQYNVFEYGDRRKYTPVRESDDYCSYGEREENMK